MSAIAATTSGGDRATESRLALRRLRSSAMFWACAAATMGVIALLIVVVGYLLLLGLPGLSWGLFTTDPTGDAQVPGGLRHAIVGTIELLALSGSVGVPVGMLAGVYLSEYSREARGWFGNVVRFVADVLAGVPSIVVGIVGYELVVVPMGHNSGWAGALALAFVMVPIVARTTEEMLRLVPDSYRAGSLALGATKSQTITRVVLPAATGSLVTGVMLALARVAGETAPLLFTALGNRTLTLDPSQPFPSLTVQVYFYVTGPYQAQKQVGWAGILVLIGILLVLNMLIRVASARAMRGRK